MENADEVAADAFGAGTLVFANTVTPSGYLGAKGKFAGSPNIRVGLGMHPWWVDGQFDADQFERLSEQERFVGEVGLDFGDRHRTNREQQLDAFTFIANICARQTGKMISIHAVKSAEAALDVLERTAALDTCTCVFHWFTGPSDQLKRAIDAGCYFSIGPRALATGKGREYCKAIPAQRLLLETDAPPEQGQRYSYAEMRTQLESAAESVAKIKGDAALAAIAEASERLLRQGA